MHTGTGRIPLPGSVNLPGHRGVVNKFIVIQDSLAATSLPGKPSQHRAGAAPVCYPIVLLPAAGPCTQAHRDEPDYPHTRLPWITRPVWTLLQERSTLLHPSHETPTLQRRRPSVPF